MGYQVLQLVNANQNHSERSYHPMENGYYPKRTKMLVGMWRKGSPGRLLVRMQISTAVMRTMQVLRNTRNRATVWPMYPPQGTEPKQMASAFLFGSIYNNQDIQSREAFICRWIHKGNTKHTMKYRSVMLFLRVTLGVSYVSVLSTSLWRTWLILNTLVALTEGHWDTLLYSISFVRGHGVCNFSWIPGQFSLWAEVTEINDFIKHGGKAKAPSVPLINFTYWP